METYDSVVQGVALALGASWASGINLYAAILALGIMGSTGSMVLPPGLEALSNPLVLAAAGLMFAIEFFADKVPGVDTGWDAIHTFIRIPAGAMLAAGAVGDIGPAAELAALLVGGSVAATSHATKAGGRVLINTSPEPVSNWTASFAEDIAVFAGLWAALNHPWIFLGLFVVFIAFSIWILPKIWRGIIWLFGKIGSFFGGREPEPLRVQRQAPGGPRDGDASD